MTSEAFDNLGEGTILSNRHFELALLLFSLHCLDSNSSSGCGIMPSQALSLDSSISAAAILFLVFKTHSAKFLVLEVWTKNHGHADFEQETLLVYHSHWKNPYGISLLIVSPHWQTFPLYREHLSLIHNHFHCLPDLLPICWPSSTISLAMK